MVSLTRLLLLLLKASVLPWLLPSPAAETALTGQQNLFHY